MSSQFEAGSSLNERNFSREAETAYGVRTGLIKKVPKCSPHIQGSDIPLPSSRLLTNMPVSQAVRKLPSGYHDLRRQPFRSLYLIYSFFTLLFVRIPIWTVLSLRRSNRSRPSWSTRRNVMVKVMHCVMGVIQERFICPLLFTLKRLIPFT